MLLFVSDALLQHAEDNDVTIVVFGALKVFLF